jgi:hypothetical protein
MNFRLRLPICQGIAKSINGKLAGKNEKKLSEMSSEDNPCGCQKNISRLQDGNYPPI